MKYHTISLPENLVNKIDNIREKNGFSSRADFVKEACRRELRGLTK